MTTEWCVAAVEAPRDVPLQFFYERFQAMTMPQLVEALLDDRVYPREIAFVVDCDLSVTEAGAMWEQRWVDAANNGFWLVFMKQRGPNSRIGQKVIPGSRLEECRIYRNRLRRQEVRDWSEAQANVKVLAGVAQVSQQLMKDMTAQIKLSEPLLHRLRKNQLDANR
jgi:hypothetical protein